MADNDWMGLFGKASWKLSAGFQEATRKHWQKNHDQGHLDFLQQEQFFLDEEDNA